MSVIVVTGLQWGDEGKGKIVDLLGEFAQVTVRFQGGNNAGHTVVLDDRSIVLNLLPSGALRAHVRCILSQGMVVDPGVLLTEMKGIEHVLGRFTPERLVISRRAHVILPVHREADALGEASKDEEGKIGTTLRGIGPAYEDKAGRRGIRMVDIIGDRDLLERRIDGLHAHWQPMFEKRGRAVPDTKETVEACIGWGRQLAVYVKDSSRILDEEVARGANILLEAAQGTLLDIDHGTYPFVTSSNACALGAPAGAGLAPSRIDGVLGIMKAYTTRVGGGPFPTEDSGEAGRRLRDRGHEFGSTTGRSRRCGWLDVPALRYAIRLNGVQWVAITKLDVLTGMPEIQVCTGYRLGGETLSEIPIDALGEAEPIMESVPGWTDDISEVRDLRELPQKVKRYLGKIEGWLGVPAHIVSVGAARNETIVVRNPFRD